MKKEEKKIETIPCPRCGKPFPKIRRDKFGYNFCVNCSTVEPVVGITTIEGTGDHTWNDLIIMEKNKVASIEKEDKKIKRKYSESELDIDIDSDEQEVKIKSLKSSLKNIDNIFPDSEVFGEYIEK